MRPAGAPAVTRRVSHRRVPLGVALVAALVTIAFPTPASAQTEAAYTDWNPDLIGFPSNTPISPRSNCAAGRDACIDRTIGEMWRRFHTVIPSCDHNNLFSLTYLRVTEDIRIAVDEGFYDDLSWINRQDAMFARVYFLTYDNWLAGKRQYVPQSWRMTFDAGRDRTVEGIGNLLLSMNAHINRDFPFILYHAGLTNPDGSTKKADHDAYNQRLRALYKPMLAELARRFDETIDDYDAPGTSIDDDTIFKILEFWRETTWQNATRLTDASSDAERRQVAQSIEEYANTQAQLIIAGSAYLPGESSAARDAQCAEHGGQRPAYRRGADVARPAPNAKLKGKNLTVGLHCPNGPGPCKGVIKIRRPRRAGYSGRSNFAPIARSRFNLGIGESKKLEIKLGKRAEALTRHATRGVWIGARSKQGPGYALTRRVKARLHVGS